MKMTMASGSGWAIMEIDEWGEVQIEGETADQRSFSTSALLTGTPDGPKVGFFAQQRNGFLSGVFTLGETVSGDLTWARDDSDSGDGRDCERRTLGRTGG